MTPLTGAVHKVLVTSALREGLVETARQEGLGHVEFVFADTDEQARAEVRDADVALVGPWNAEMLRAAGRLRWVHADHGGVTGDLFPEFVESPVHFTCLKPVFGAAGSEAALAAMLMFSRRLHHMGRRRRGLDWLESQDHVLGPEEIAGKTVGIVGLGHMGRALAVRAGCLGLRVLATARSPRAAPEGVDRMIVREQLPELLRESDYVVVSVPLTAETTGMVGEDFLGGMKRTAFLVDLSGRLAIFDWSALVAAVEEGRIAGVCLQPSGHDAGLGMPPPGSAFWDRENVVVTPCRVTSREMGQRSLDLFFGNLRRLQDGRPLEGLVDKRAGY